MIKFYLILEEHGWHVQKEEGIFNDRYWNKNLCHYKCEYLYYEQMDMWNKWCLSMFNQCQMPMSGHNDHKQNNV